jgi:hypothetical protein
MRSTDEGGGRRRRRTIAEAGRAIEAEPRRWRASERSRHSEGRAAPAETDMTRRRAERRPRSGRSRGGQRAPRACRPPGNFTQHSRVQCHQHRSREHRDAPGVACRRAAYQAQLRDLPQLEASTSLPGQHAGVRRRPARAWHGRALAQLPAGSECCAQPSSLTARSRATATPAAARRACACSARSSPAATRDGEGRPPPGGGRPLPRPEGLARPDALSRSSSPTTWGRRRC